MARIDIIQTLENKQKKPEELVDKVLGDPKLLPTIFDGTTATKANVKYGSTKILRLISEKDPKVLYPKMDFFIKMMESENQILKWNGMDIVANLLVVDSKNKFDKIFDKYYSLLSDEVMITAGHVIDNSGKIVMAKPYFTDKITNRLLKVENISRDQECQNILLGKTILAFNSYFDQINNNNKTKVISFVRRQLNNTRPATRKKAEKFLKKVEKKHFR